MEKKGGVGNAGSAVIERPLACRTGVEAGLAQLIGAISECHPAVWATLQTASIHIEKRVIAQTSSAYSQRGTLGTRRDALLANQQTGIRVGAAGTCRGNYAQRGTSIQVERRSASHAGGAVGLG